MSFLRIYEIAESNHRVHDPISLDKLLTLGRAIGLTPGTRVLDLACGSGEMLAQWALEHQIDGLGVDLSEVFTAAARARVAELEVSDRVRIETADAAGFVADSPCDVVACLGATWIGDGMEGTVELLRRSLKPGGTILIGEPFWRREPPAEAAGAFGVEPDEWGSLPELIERFIALDCDVVEMVLGSQDDFDRYVAPSWRNLRTWLDENPGDDFAPTVRERLDSSVRTHTRYQREYLGWGVFALRPRG